MAATEITTYQIIDLKAAAEEILGSRCTVRQFMSGRLEIHVEDNQEG